MASEPVPDKNAAELQFRLWYTDRAKRLGLNPNPDDPRHHYDYRAAYAAGAEPDETGHWPSEFKAEDHPRRYLPLGPHGETYDTATMQPAPGKTTPEHRELLKALQALEAVKMKEFGEIEQKKAPKGDKQDKGSARYPALAAAVRPQKGRYKLAPPIEIGSKEDWDTVESRGAAPRQYFPDRTYPGFSGPATVEGESYVTPEDRENPMIYGGEDDDYRIPNLKPNGPTLYEIEGLPMNRKRKVYSL